MLYCSLNINKDKNVHRFEPRGRKDNEREKGGEGKERERQRKRAQQAKSILF